jgi:hypothetical protein
MRVCCNLVWTTKLLESEVYRCMKLPPRSIWADGTIRLCSNCCNSPRLPIHTYLSVSMGSGRAYRVRLYGTFSGSATSHHNLIPLHLSLLPPLHLLYRIQDDYHHAYHHAYCEESNIRRGCLQNQPSCNCGDGWTGDFSPASTKSSGSEQSLVVDDTNDISPSKHNTP